MPLLGRRRLALLVLSLALIPSYAAAAPAKPPPAAPVPDDLPARHRAFLEETAPLLSPKERDAFLALKEDYQRDAFIDRFWEVRDRGRASGEFRREWEARVAQVRAQYGRLTDERARVLLLNGPPIALIAEHCNVLLWPIEAWFYHGSERLGTDFAVVFYQVWGAGQWRIWEPAVGLAELFQEQLRSFDLVFLQNFNFGPYGIGAYLGEIRRYVEEGGGLAMIGGDLSFTSGGWQGTPVADVLPVELLPDGPPEQVLIDSSAVKAHRCASGGKGGSAIRRSAARAAGAQPKSMP